MGQKSSPHSTGHWCTLRTAGAAQGTQGLLHNPVVLLDLAAAGPVVAAVTAVVVGEGAARGFAAQTS